MLSVVAKHWERKGCALAKAHWTIWGRYFRWLHNVCRTPETNSCSFRKSQFYVRRKKKLGSLLRNTVHFARRLPNFTSQFILPTSDTCDWIINYCFRERTAMKPRLGGFITHKCNKLGPRDAEEQIGPFCHASEDVCLSHVLRRFTVRQSLILGNSGIRITHKASIYKLSIIFQLTTSITPHQTSWSVKRKVI